MKTETPQGTTGALAPRVATRRRYLVSIPLTYEQWCQLPARGEDNARRDRLAALIPSRMRPLIRGAEEVRAVASGHALEVHELHLLARLTERDLASGPARGLMHWPVEEDDTFEPVRRVPR